MDYQFTVDAARVLKKARIREEILATKFFPFIIDAAQVLKKARIREEIRAREASENLMLEEEVLRELEWERKMSRWLPEDQHVIREEILTREASENRMLEEKVRRELELERKITMKLQEEQRLRQLQPVTGEEILASEFFPVTIDAEQVLRKARVRKEILAREASENHMLEEEVLRELELKRTRNLQEKQRLGQLQPVISEEILAREASLNRMLEEEVLRELELERKITRTLQEEEVRHELELERKMFMKLKEEQGLGQLRGESAGFTGDQACELNKARMLDEILARQAEENQLPEKERELQFNRRMTQRLHEVLGQFLMPAHDRFTPYPSEPRVGNEVLGHGLADVQRPPLPVSHQAESRTAELQVLMPQNPDVQRPPLPVYHHARRPPLPISHHPESRDEEMLQVSPPHHCLDPEPGEGSPIPLIDRLQMRLAETSSALSDHNSGIGIAGEMSPKEADVGDHNKDGTSSIRRGLG